MTTRASPKATRSPKQAKQITPYPPVVLTDEMRKRFAELALPRPHTDEVCPACGGATGIPKMLRDGKTQWICVPCHITLHYYAYTFDVMQWRLLRLPAYRLWLNRPDEASRLLMQLTNQETYSK